jgi:signal transduction histidine kinase
MRHSIRTRLIVSVTGLAIIPLLLIGVIVGIQTFNAQTQAALALQHEVAGRETSQIANFFHSLQEKLETVARSSELKKATTIQQQILLSGLLAQDRAFDEIFLLDSTGREQAGVSRTKAVTNTDLASRAQADEFKEPATNNQIYYSPVHVDPFTGEPLVTVGIPIQNLETGKVDNVLVADLRFIVVQDLFVGNRATNAERNLADTFYMVDSNNDVVAHNDPSVTLRGLTFTPPAQDGVQKGLGGQSAVLASEKLQLGNQTLTIVAETPTSQALALAFNTVTVTAVLVLVVLLAAILIGFGIVNQLVKPIVALAATAEAIRLGDFSKRAEVGRKDEIGQFAAAFNEMTDAIQKREADLRDQADALRIATAKAREAARVKGEFLANVSHELRTPLNAIIGFSDMLLMGMSGPLNDKQRHKMERLKENGSRLLSLINDLLDITRIEAGRLEMVQKPFAPKALAERMSAQMESLAEQSNLKFEVRVSPDMPETVLGDEKRVEQVVVNLLSNAFKFTKEGSVTLEIYPDHAEQTWNLVVTDTGIGIPPHAVNIIFEEFRQLDGSYSRAYKGSGLGLSITRNLVRMMGGKISVKSVLESGSTFTVVLPLVTDEKMAQPVLEAAAN